jgi:hypothetical protein
MKALTYDDRVWINSDRKLDGVCRDVLQAQDNGLNVLVVAHFDSSLTSFAATLRQRAIDFHSFLAFDRKSLCEMNPPGEPGKVRLALSSQLHADNFAAGHQSEQVALRALVIEHHPLAIRDASLLNALNALDCRSEISFHSALTDPLLLHFGGERIEGFLRRMGLEDEECVSHELISRAIRGAQEKIGSQVRQEMQTQSAEDWFKYNLRERLW